MKPAALLIASTLALAGCSVGDSTPMGDFVRDGRAECSSALGYYSLPKAVVRLEVKRSIENGHFTLKQFQDLPFEIRHVPDPTLNFCFRHNSTIFANDKIVVTKANGPDGKTKTSFLSNLTINATDQTVTVLNRLLRVAYLLASRDVNFEFRDGAEQAKASETVVDLEFDPLDPDEVHQANKGLAPYGFCFVADDFIAPPGRGASVCGHRGPRKVEATPPPGLAYREVSRQSVPSGPGVAYRPMQPVTVSIYRKSDPTGPDPWLLDRRDRISIENASPVLSLRIDRALFAGRRTVLVFDNGALKSACVSQSSGVLNAATLPIEILRSLIALPASVAKVQLAETERSKNLLGAKANSIDAEMVALGSNSKYYNTIRSNDFALNSIDFGDNDQTLSEANTIARTRDATDFNNQFVELCN